MLGSIKASLRGLELPRNHPLTGLELLLTLLQRYLLSPIEARLGGLEVLLGRLKRLLSSNALVGQGHLLGAIKRSLGRLEDLLRLLLASREGLLALLQVGLLSAIQVGLRALEPLLRGLQSRLGFDALVAESALLCAVELVLRSLESLLGLLKRGLLRPVQRRLLRSERLLRLLQVGLLDAVELRLCRLKILLSGLERLLRSHALVGQRDLLSAVEISLRPLEVLLRPQDVELLRTIQLRLGSLEDLLSLLKVGLRCNRPVGKRDLLSPVQVRLSGLERLLSLKDSILLIAIHVGLRSLEVLARNLQGSRGLNALVGQGDLLRPIKLTLRGLECALSLVLLGLEGLRPHPLVGLELTLRLVLSRSELLVSALQAKLVLLRGAEHAGLVHGVLVGQRALVVGVGVLLRDRRDAVDHLSHGCALCHGAVDQAALIHPLRAQGARTLQQRGVFGQQGFDLTRRGLRGPVDLALLRRELRRPSRHGSGSTVELSGSNVKGVGRCHTCSKRKSRSARAAFCGRMRPRRF